MAESDPADEPRHAALTARVETELLAALDRIAAEDSRPGAPVTRSQTVRVLLWDAVARRPAPARQGA